MENHPQTLLVHNPTNHNKLAMEKFREFVSKFAEAQPNTPLTPARKTLLQDRLNRVVSQYKTPDHQPYSAMIERVLGESNNRWGSTEDSISKFIEKEYDNLPWAHSTLLKHHLEKLCESGDIILTRGNRYKLAGENHICRKTKKKRRKNIWKFDWERKRRMRQKKQLLNEKKDEQKFEKVENIQELDDEINSSEGKQVKEEKDEYALSSPEVPPGFESIIVENLSRLEPKEVEIASNEDLLESRRARRQSRRWSEKMDSNKLDSISQNVLMKTEGPTLFNEREASRGAPMPRRSPRAAHAKPEDARECPGSVHIRAGRAKERSFGQAVGPIKDSCTNEVGHGQVKVELLEEFVECTSICEKMEGLRTNGQVGPTKRRPGRPPICGQIGKVSKNRGRGREL